MILRTGIKYFNVFYLKRLKLSYLLTVFWVDPVQKDIYSDIAATLKELENLHVEVKISDAVLVVETADDDEEYGNKADLSVNTSNMKSCKIYLEFHIYLF